jgi:hypothetical protein
MLDRKFEGKELPPNLLFIACCNPYRMKLGGKASRDIGLVVNQKTSILSHVVHVVPDRLLDIVWNFGQLSEEDEKHHILSMVRGEKDLFPDHRNLMAETVDELQVKLALVIHQCHSLVRKFEEKSGVSLRDIKRVFVIFIFFRKTFIKMKKEQQKRIRN